MMKIYREEEMKAILLTGMPGCGKSIFTEVATKYGLPVISMGDCVREETEKRGLEPRPENVARVSIKLREELGDGAIAHLTLKKIKELSLDKHKNNVIVIDGVRSLAEVEVFKQFFNKILIVAIHASPLVRYNRILKRGRTDDAKTFEQLKKRDLRELGFGIGNVIALADIMLINENKSKEEFAKECEQVIRKILVMFESNK